MNVQGTEITVQHTDKGDYISLTDMAEPFGGADVIKNWLRNKSTLEFLAAWEKISNPDFNWVELDLIVRSSGVDRFVISVKQWVERTQAVGIMARAGRYDSGTFAHHDIALEFATALSPEFKLYVLKEFQRLIEDERRGQGLEWNLKRVLSKANYQVQTDAIKETLIPSMGLKPSDEWMAYTTEADLLNQVVFGMSAKEWRAQNPTAKKNENMRDYAAWISLAVLSNLESQNATMIRDEIPKMQRFYKLSEVARQHFNSLSKSTALREHGKAAEAGIKPLSSPKPPPSGKPPATGGELKKRVQRNQEADRKYPRPAAQGSSRPKVWRSNTANRARSATAQTRR